jgi:hypothetical protein
VSAPPMTAAPFETEEAKDPKRLSLRSSDFLKSSSFAERTASSLAISVAMTQPS